MKLYQPAVLALANGMTFQGVSAGVSGVEVGELIFNTAMTGYQEIITDPSYAKQFITFTYPHIGNVGTNPDDFEANRVCCSGIVMRELPTLPSNWRAEKSLTDFLQQHNILAIAGIDTRHLTHILRDQGAQSACLMAGECEADQAIAKAKAFAGLQGLDLAKEVTCSETYAWQQGEWQYSKIESIAIDAKYHVIVYDFGVKQNILRMLVERGCRLTVVPAQTPIDTVLAQKPDGVFFSNGPGDPAACHYAIEAIKVCLDQNVPIFGICLGFQLLALAAGAKTEKMKFGHHGANHPVIDVDSKKVFISSQNHSFAVSEASLPKHLRATHRSLFDNSLQGIAHNDKPAFGFQGHPEASPGPHDLAEIFDQFVMMLK